MSGWFGIGLLILVSVLTGIGHICFKLVAVRNLTLREKLIASKFVLGTFCFLLGPLLAVVAAKYVSFSLLYAMSSLNFVFILFFSKWLLGERVDFRKLCGVATIVLGLVMIALERI